MATGRVQSFRSLIIPDIMRTDAVVASLLVVLPLMRERRLIGIGIREFQLHQFVSIHLLHLYFRCYIVFHLYFSSEFQVSSPEFQVPSSEFCANRLMNGYFLAVNDIDALLEL